MLVLYCLVIYPHWQLISTVQCASQALVGFFVMPICCVTFFYASVAFN